MQVRLIKGAYLSRHFDALIIAIDDFHCMSRPASTWVSEPKSSIPGLLAGAKGFESSLKTEEHLRSISVLQNRCVERGDVSAIQSMRVVRWCKSYPIQRPCSRLIDATKSSDQDESGGTVWDESTFLSSSKSNQVSANMTVWHAGMRRPDRN